MVPFPKRFMRQQELLRMGIDKSLLDRARAERGQRFIMKLDPLKQNSPILVDTEGLARWMDREMKAQEDARDGT